MNSVVIVHGVAGIRMRDNARAIVEKGVLLLTIAPTQPWSQYVFILAADRIQVVGERSHQALIGLADLLDGHDIELANDFGQSFNDPRVVEFFLPNTWMLNEAISRLSLVRTGSGDQAGIERLIQYMTLCPFSLSRLTTLAGRDFRQPTD